uniref:F-box only protein 16-like n=1 Tax=Phallusia mammillata TaxID=59560 RepID=A0A6F9DCL7_9ASCI|nr:F-box only protein 16-like [Phallusia mammillata]
MAFAPPVKSKVSTNLAKSTWTPINNSDANNQVFGERRELIMKWFQKWQESQKKIVVEDILKNLSNKHLISISEMLKGKFPQEKHDFTKIFPRVLTLYIFSYLDPRTLCRCSQVSWYWNYLAEMDCLWRPKCLKFGWYPVYQPSPFEEKVWKRFYVTTVHDLNYAKAKSIEAKAREAQESHRPDTARSAMSRVSTARSNISTATGLMKGPSTPSPKKPLAGPKWEPPPWKGSDKNPMDTMRYNYLDNSAKGKKKPTDVPGSRPSSRRSRRPQSATTRDRKSTHVESGAPFVSKSPQKHILPPEHTGRQSVDHNAGQTVGLSPRLDKNFQLPQYNGHESAVPLSKDLGQNTVQYGANETITNRQAMNLTQRFASPPVTQGGHSSTIKSPRQDGSPYSTPDITKLSMDAGTMPKPVMRMSAEKPKKKQDVTEEVSQKEKVVLAQSSKSLSTNNTDDLKGQGWTSPPNQNSDEDD